MFPRFCCSSAVCNVFPIIYSSEGVGPLYFIEKECKGMCVKRCEKQKRNWDRLGRPRQNGKKLHGGVATDGIWEPSQMAETRPCHLLYSVFCPYGIPQKGWTPPNFIEKDGAQLQRDLCEKIWEKGIAECSLCHLSFVWHLSFSYFPLMFSIEQFAFQWRLPKASQRFWCQTI